MGALIAASAPASATESYNPAIALALDGGVASRSLTWKDDLFGLLRPYKLAPAPILGGEITLFPAVPFANRPLTWLGVAVRGEGLVGVKSQRTEHDQALPTRAWAFSAVVRGRVPVSWGAAWLDAGVAGRGFSIDAVGYTKPDIPSVRYLGPQVGGGAEVDLPVRFPEYNLFIAGRGALSRWVTAGDLASAAWFPHARAWGAELALRIGITTPIYVSPYLDASWSRDIAALRPQPGEAHVAGGLADDRFSLKLGLEGAFPPRN